MKRSCTTMLRRTVRMASSGKPDSSVIVNPNVTRCRYLAVAPMKPTGSPLFIAGVPTT